VLGGSFKKPEGTEFPNFIENQETRQKTKNGWFQFKTQISNLTIEIGEPTGFTAYPTSFFGLSFIFFILLFEAF
jgi:hypothetical protein